MSSAPPSETLSSAKWVKRKTPGAGIGDVTNKQAMSPKSSWLSSSDWNVSHLHTGFLLYRSSARNETNKKDNIQTHRSYTANRTHLRSGSKTVTRNGSRSVHRPESQREVNLINFFHHPPSSQLAHHHSTRLGRQEGQPVRKTKPPKIVTLTIVITRDWKLKPAAWTRLRDLLLICHERTAWKSIELATTGLEWFQK